MPSFLQPATEGQTKPLVHQLLSNKLPVSIEGFDIELIMHDSSGEVVDTTGKVTNLDDGTDANKGKVQFSPGADDLLSSGSPYTLHWKVTDGVGKVDFWPNGDALRLKVSQQ